jgi:arginine decarboxylase
VAGHGEGGLPLNAFDAALVEAGIGNLNLLRVSSILPPSTKLTRNLEIPPGSLTPTAYGFITSSQPGQVIAAAIGVGIGNPDSYGVIMEFEGYCTKNEAEASVRKMVEEGFERRGLTLQEVHVQGIEHRVEAVGSVIAAAVLWYGSGSSLQARANARLRVRSSKKKS